VVPIVRVPTRTSTSSLDVTTSESGKIASLKSVRCPGRIRTARRTSPRGLTNNSSCRPAVSTSCTGVIPRGSSSTNTSIADGAEVTSSCPTSGAGPGAVRVTGTSVQNNSSRTLAAWSWSPAGVQILTLATRATASNNKSDGRRARGSVTVGTSGATGSSVVVNVQSSLIGRRLEESSEDSESDSTAPPGLSRAFSTRSNFSRIPFCRGFGDTFGGCHGGGATLTSEGDCGTGCWSSSPIGVPCTARQASGPPSPSSTVPSYAGTATDRNSVQIWAWLAVRPRWSDAAVGRPITNFVEPDNDPDASSPWCKSRLAPRPALGPSNKARRGRIPAACDR